MMECNEAYAETGNQEVIAHGGPEEIVAGLVLDGVYEGLSKRSGEAYRGD